MPDPGRHDWLEKHDANDGSVSRLPLIQVDDQSYIGRPHVVVMDDSKRKQLAEGLDQVRRGDDRSSADRASERKVIYVTGIAICCASLTAAAASVAGLLLSLHVI